MAASVFQLYPDGEPAKPTKPNTTEIFATPDNPMGVARALLEGKVQDGQLVLRHWRDQWMQYRGPHWVEQEYGAVRGWMYKRLEKAQYDKYNPHTKQDELKPWNPNRSKVADVREALESIILLPQETCAPCWLDTGKPATDVVPCANGLVNINDQTLSPATPRYFGLFSVPFNYDPTTPEPTEWLSFLRGLWAQVTGSHGEMVDADEIRALQEWFGYILSGRTNLQKIMFLKGPKRSGKGTIGRILGHLVGAENHVGTDMASLMTNFGMAPLINKSLAVFGDVRLGAQGQERVIERLLSISGEDTMTVDRKNRDPWVGRIPARLMLLSNELPKFSDVSGAIASRFVILAMNQSFLGNEDTGLEARLVAELPGILRWAMEGLARLDRQGRITVPDSSMQEMATLEELVSPMTAFLKDVCIVDNAARTPTGTLYAEYGAWCDENGRGRSSIQKWSSDMRTLLPGCKTDLRPKVNGVSQQRHTTGLSINPEWSTRVKDHAASTAWRDSGGEYDR